MRLTSDILQINKEKLLKAFPTNLTQDVEIVADFLVDKNFDIHPTVEQEIILNGEKLIIPGRIYFDTPTETIENTLTTTQRIILNCIYLRHNNGFVRQKCLEKLIENGEDYYVIPFIFQLLGEYVMEILEVVDKHINGQTICNYLKFISENPRYSQQTESRMISYWDVYHRRTKFKKLQDYIGFQIFIRLKESDRTIPKLSFCLK